MTCWVVIPIKAPEACKTRLRPALGEAARRELVAGMLRHVVEVAGAEPAVDAVRLIGPSRHGLPAEVQLLADPGQGLNPALAAALTAAAAAGVTRLVVLAGDLPRLAAEDLAALASLDAGELGVAPDRKGLGTNALSLPLPQARDFHFQYGPDSFARHAAEAVRLGLKLQTVRSETLGLDVDDPADLAALPTALSSPLR
ncbi:2-phospho-L-lactate guanylyltransferase [Phenylobacterium sp. LjRoot219]|uniref:2-phospho-L-lactate guanylyltransferase n=1 Tax=Phenylobacterium sp. LjRoot219 TaxID=3342283 RepID=UPI003ED152F9